MMRALFVSGLCLHVLFTGLVVVSAEVVELLLLP
jgi:hypothetical protein